MKPLDNSGDLVDFKERMIFEREKDFYEVNCKSFIYKMWYKYKVVVSPALYRKIINYQIEKYGQSLAISKDDPKLFGKRIKESRRTARRKRGLRAMTWEERKNEK